MTDNEKIQSFGDMVDAAQKLSEPWQKSALHMKILLGVTNLFWAFVLAMFIWFAYMSPVEMDQEQSFDEHIQNQSYSEGVTGR